MAVEKGERDRGSEGERETERERESNRNIHPLSTGSIPGHNMPHTVVRAPTDPPTWSCSWDNRSGRGKFDPAKDDTRVYMMLSTTDVYTSLPQGRFAKRKLQFLFKVAPSF